MAPNAAVAEATDHLDGDQHEASANEQEEDEVDYGRGDYGLRPRDYGRSDSATRRGNDSCGHNIGVRSRNASPSRGHLADGEFPYGSMRAKFGRSPTRKNLGSDGQKMWKEEQGGKFNYGNQDFERSRYGGFKIFGYDGRLGYDARYGNDGRFNYDGRFGLDARYGYGRRYGFDGRYGSDGRYGFDGRYGSDERYGLGGRYGFDGRNVFDGRYGDFDGRYGGFDGRYGGSDGRYSGFDGRYGGFDGRFGGLDGRYGGFDGRFGGLDGRYGGLDGRFGGLDGRYGGLDGKYELYDGGHRFYDGRQGNDGKYGFEGRYANDGRYLNFDEANKQFFQGRPTQISRDGGPIMYGRNYSGCGHDLSYGKNYMGGRYRFGREYPFGLDRDGKDLSYYRDHERFALGYGSPRSYLNNYDQDMYRFRGGHFGEFEPFQNYYGYDFYGRYPYYEEDIDSFEWRGSLPFENDYGRYGRYGRNDRRQEDPYFPYGRYDSEPYRGHLSTDQYERDGYRGGRFQTSLKKGARGRNYLCDQCYEGPFRASDSTVRPGFNRVRAGIRRDNYGYDSQKSRWFGKPRFECEPMEGCSRVEFAVDQRGNRMG